MGAMHHQGGGMFRDLPSPFQATRYHSLIVEKASLPACLEVTAWLEDGTIMGLRHREKLIEGVQFHPESIASEHGHHLLKNFLDAAKARVAA
jgi:anthranilate synthase component 2